MKRLKRGGRISMAITFRCNLSCNYCVADKPHGKTPQANEATFEELKTFMLRFPHKLREVKLTGGSPELHKAFVPFVNWLLSEGYYVTVFTNLCHTKTLQQLNKSRRLIFIASYHHDSMNVIKYTALYNKIKQGYRIVVHELGKQQKLTYSRLYPLLEEKDFINDSLMIRVAPDLTMQLDCWNIYNKAKT